MSALGLAERTHRFRAWMGIGLGIGLALIVDELALLVELKDVDWPDSGWASVAAAVLIIGVGGSALALSRSPHVDDED